MATYCGTLLMLSFCVMSTVADEPRRADPVGISLRPLTARQLNRVGSSRRSIRTQADRRHSNIHEVITCKHLSERCPIFRSPSSAGMTFHEAGTTSCITSHGTTRLFTSPPFSIRT